MIRILATKLEKGDNPAIAITPCRVCLEELHALSAVKKSFSIALTNGWMSWFGKDERNAIIAAVCDINHGIFNMITIMVRGNALFWSVIHVEQRMCIHCETQELLKFICRSQNTLVATLCNGSLEWTS